MATDLTKDLTVALSNNVNSQARAYQGIYLAEAKGATGTTRTGTIKLSGISTYHIGTL